MTRLTVEATRKLQTRIDSLVQEFNTLVDEHPDDWITRDMSNIAAHLANALYVAYMLGASQVDALEEEAKNAGTD